MKNIIFILLSFALLLLACSSPLDKKFNEKTFADDVASMKGKVDTSDLALLAMSMMRMKFQGLNLENMTYRQMLEQGRQWKVEREQKEAEEKRLAEQARLEAEAKARRLNEALSFVLFEKGFNQQMFQSYITYKFAIENKSDKDIKAFTGQVIFTDLFDKPIKTINLTYDEGVKAKSKKNYPCNTDFNEFMDQDVALRSKTIDQLKCNWQPEKILFSDGSTLE